MTHLFVATPCFGGLVTATYSASVLKLDRACAAKGITLECRFGAGDAMISRAHAELVASFLETSATHILFIDADIGFEPEQVFRLLDFNAAVTAAAYPLKYLDWDKIKRAADASRPNLATAALNYVLMWHGAQVMVKNGFARVRFAAGGFLLVQRSAIEHLCDAHPELAYRYVHMTDKRDKPIRVALFDPIIEEGAYLSEDYAFCKRWTDMGGEIWIDTQSKLSHTGPIMFQGDLSSQFQR